MNRELQIEKMIKRTIVEFASELHGYKVFLFGSRVSGSSKRGSDFDVGVLGKSPLPLKTFFAIEDAFDKLPTLYQIDWVDLNKVNQQFLEQALKNTKIIHE